MTFMPPVFDSGRRRWRRADPLVRMVVSHWALGMAVGAIVGVGMLAFDALGLRTLMRHAQVEIIGGVLFVAGFAFTLGGVVAATAAMRAGQDDDDEPRGGLRAPALAYAVARAR